MRCTLYDVFKSVADLCFTGPFAVLGKAKYQYRPLRVSTDGRMDATKHIIKAQTVQAGVHRQTNKRTDRQTDATKCIISPALRSIINGRLLGPIGTRMMGINDGCV